MKSLVLIILFIFLSFNSNAQIFGRIIDRAADKVMDRVEDRIADELTKAAMKPIDQAMDEMLREKYKQDSINGETTVDYTAFLKAYMTPVDLPETYGFDIKIDAEVKDYDNEKTDVVMYLSVDGSKIGIEQTEDNGIVLIVFDAENDIFAIYNESKEDKTVQAFPSTFTGSLMKNAIIDSLEIVITKTGKTKRILNYETDEYEIEDEATVTKSYIAEDFPFSWRDSFSPFMNHYFPTTQREKMPDGISLKSETKSKKKGKKSSFEVKKITEQPIAINNSEYKKISYSTTE